MMAGSATSSSRMRDEPWWPHNAAPSTRREVSAAGRRPASPAAGSGFGVRSSQIPPSAVAAIRYRSSSWGASPCQDCAVSGYYRVRHSVPLPAEVRAGQ